MSPVVTAATSPGAQTGNARRSPRLLGPVSRTGIGPSFLPPVPRSHQRPPPPSSPPVPQYRLRVSVALDEPVESLRRWRTPPKFHGTRDILTSWRTTRKPMSSARSTRKTISTVITRPFRP